MREKAVVGVKTIGYTGEDGQYESPDFECSIHMALESFGCL